MITSIREIEREEEPVGACLRSATSLFRNSQAMITSPNFDFELKGIKKMIRCVPPTGPASCVRFSCDLSSSW